MLVRLLFAGFVSCFILIGLQSDGFAPTHIALLLADSAGGLADVLFERGGEPGHFLKTDFVGNLFNGYVTGGEQLQSFSHSQLHQVLVGRDTHRIAEDSTEMKP